MLVKCFSKSEESLKHTNIYLEQEMVVTFIRVRYVSMLPSSSYIGTERLGGTS